MPTRKQKRRRKKDRRHEYEFVYVDDEGHEFEAPPPAANGKAAHAPPAAPPRADGKARGSGTGARATRQTRTVDPPSWRRVGKRALIFAPIMFVTVSLLDRGLGVAGQVLVTLQMLVLFVPFSYLVDRMMYRRSLRDGAAPAARRRGTSHGDR